MSARLPLIALLLLALVSCHAKADKKVALIDGSCEHARPIGDPADYKIPLRVKKSDLGFIRVRADASWPSEDRSNVLGTIPSGTLVWAEGPLKDAEGSAGIGYAL